MNRDYIVVFGSAVTGCYRVGETQPHDIDVISNMSHSETVKIVGKWSISKFGTILPIDIHTQSVEDIEIPCLDIDTPSYIILQGDPVVIPFVRNTGFASVLRLHGNDPELDYFNVTQYLSLLPPQYSYADNGTNNDKYYSGLAAYRNAASHVNNLDTLLSRLNCGRILKRLLTEDAKNWQASPDITDDPLPYGHGWSLAVMLNISCNLHDPVFEGSDGSLVYEDQAIGLLW